MNDRYRLITHNDCMCTIELLITHPDVTALLHGDDPELVLLVDPDEEGLGVVVEDAAALGPVALHAGGDEVLVARDEQEVVVDELQPHLLVHAEQRVVVTL